LAARSGFGYVPSPTYAAEGRLPEGFWKNAHLFSGGKAGPAPLGRSRGGSFEDFHGELTETESVIYRRRSNRVCAQNMVLAAHLMGLGTCDVDLITRTIVHSRKLRKKLGIAHPFEIATALVLGYPKGQIDGIVEREKSRIEWMR
jgi:nitroreductase